MTTISSQNDAAQPLIEAWALAEDHARANRHSHKTKGFEALLARAAQRALLAHVTGQKTWRIESDAAGKPFVTSPDGKRGPHISWSHTHQLIACAVSPNAPIGIDVEFWKTRDFISLATRAFGEQERAEIAHAKTAQESMAAFYRIWVLREAIAKLTGKGIFAHMDGNDLAANALDETFWAAGEYQLFHTSPQPNYSLAVATQNKQPVLSFVQNAALK